MQPASVRVGRNPRISRISSGGRDDNDAFGAAAVFDFLRERKCFCFLSFEGIVSVLSRKFGYIALRGVGIAERAVLKIESFCKT